MYTSMYWSTTSIYPRSTFGERVVIAEAMKWLYEPLGIITNTMSVCQLQTPHIYPFENKYYREPLLAKFCLEGTPFDILLQGTPINIFKQGTTFDKKNYRELFSIFFLINIPILKQWHISLHVIGLAFYYYILVLTSLTNEKHHI